MKENDFQGDLTDVSAKKKSLQMVMPDCVERIHARHEASFSLLESWKLSRQCFLFRRYVYIATIYCLGDPLNYLFIFIIK